MPAFTLLRPRSQVSGRPTHPFRHPDVRLDGLPAGQFLRRQPAPSRRARPKASKVSRMNVRPFFPQATALEAGFDGGLRQGGDGQ